MRGVRTTTDCWARPSRGGSVEWAQAWLAGRLDAAHASALTVAACAVCGVRCAAGGPSFRGAELYVASDGAEYGPPRAQYS
jgi:hypothetical protein